MISNHVKVFARVYLEDRAVIDSSNLKAFIEREAKLPVTYEETIVALREMCQELELSLLIDTGSFVSCKKPEVPSLPITP